MGVIVGIKELIASWIVTVRLKTLLYSRDAQDLQLGARKSPSKALRTNRKRD